MEAKCLNDSPCMCLQKLHTCRKSGGEDSCHETLGLAIILSAAFSHCTWYFKNVSRKKKKSAAMCTSGALEHSEKKTALGDAAGLSAIMLCKDTSIVPIAVFLE